MSKGSTPVMKQFWDAKKNHPNAIMLFRMGDFYETFEQDAILTSDILGIALTKRANGAASTVPLAGFPYHALDQHLHKLLKAGHRVAVCEQVEDPKLTKGIVKREVIEVISPGTALTDKYLDRKENNYLCAVTLESRKCGIALLDYSTGEFHTCSRPRENLLTLLKQFHVSEVIIPEDQESDLKTLIRGEKIFTSEIPDWCRSYDTAYDSLTSFFNVSSLKGFGIKNDQPAVISAGCALYYVDRNFKGRTEHIQSLSLLQENGIMGLDAFTIRNLEIFQSLSNQGVHGTLIGTIDETITGAGSRLLKNWLRQPLTDPEKINERLNRINDFIDDSKILETIQAILKETSDLERIIARIATGKASPRDVLNVGITLSKKLLIQNSIKKKTPALRNLVEQFADTDKIAQSILHIIQDEPPVSTNKGGYISDGILSELDELRLLSSNASKWMTEMQIQERERNNIPSLKVGYNRVFGYYLEVTKPHVDKVPEHYIRKQTLTNSERYFTEELKEYEEKILSAENKIITLELRLFDDLQKEILDIAKSIQQNAKILAQLDVAGGLSKLAIKRKYIRPKLDPSPGLFIKNGRHPVVEDLLPMGEDFIPNDLQLDHVNTQIAIITGPNMAGKSTFLRQIGLITILAQMGSYIPAESAKIGVVDKLFTRVGASDNLAGGESTFLVEMNETANILNNATEKSLILLDEIGRGTSTYDGLSLAWAVTEYLHYHKAVQANTLFATHYHELVSLADQLPRAINLNVAVKEFGKKIIFLKKIIAGGADKSYGVHVAEMAGLPQSIIQRAKEILHQQSSEKSGNTPEINLDVKPQMDLFSEKEKALQNELSKLDINDMTPMDALTKLDELKNKHGL
jgi:DNA mismatch repair protein MutS